MVSAAPDFLATRDAVHLLIRLVEQLEATGDYLDRFGADRLRATIHRLTVSLRQYFGLHMDVQSEQQALAIVKSVAGELTASAQALLASAATLNKHGHVVAANKAHAAGKRAERAAWGVTGGGA